MNRLSDLNISNQNLVIRVDMNVPIEDGVVTDSTRILACMPTIKFALKNNAKVLLVTHLGRPIEGTFDKKFSLKPVANEVTKILDREVDLIDDLDSAKIFNGSSDIQILENIRFFEGEKSNCNKLGNLLSSLGDIYVFDAFGTSHRKQASTYEAIIQSKEACAGFLLKNEVEALNKSLQNPPKPNIAIIGGAKVSSKLGLIKNLKDKTDFIIVGGGITNTFLKASGHEVGSSLVEDSMLDIAREILESGKVLLPSRVIVSSTFEGDNIAEKGIDEISANEMILDQVLTEDIKEAIEKSKLILWNGPVGVFENELFSKGTKDLAKNISESQGFSIAGGGETLSAINTFINKDDVSYCSTGGGAFLEFMEGKKLPSIEALESKYL